MPSAVLAGHLCPGGTSWFCHPQHSNGEAVRTVMRLVVLRTFRRATGVSRALRARNPQKSLKKISRGRRGKKVRKVWKKSRKCLFGTFSRLFPDFWGPRGLRPRETVFQTFWGFRAQRARETPVARRRVRNCGPENKPGQPFLANQFGCRFF